MAGAYSAGRLRSLGRHRFLPHVTIQFLPVQPAKSKNIEAAGPECLVWNPADVTASIQALLNYVEAEAQKSINWYWRNKRAKSFFSRWIQFFAVVLTSAGALFPIIGRLADQKWMSDSLWASLFVGLAAALLALDKAFGFSSGWVRYVMAATNIRAALEAFRMDWIIQSAKVLPNPTPEQLETLLKTAREFRVSIEALVAQETKDWVSEFQSNMAQMEKDINAQLAALKAANEKAAQAQAAATQPGSIQLTVPNADKADAATVQVRLENSKGAVVTESIVGSKTWVRLSQLPDHYSLTVSAGVGGKPASATAVVIVKPGEVAQVSVPLPV